MPPALRAALLALALATPAAAHHPAAPPAAPAPFPLEIRADFALVDDAGAPMTQADLAGRPALVFFGYASCRSTCPVALPLMAEALDRLGPAGAGIPALLITVDPERDTPQAMRRALAAHPRLTGLTGSEAALAAARAAFQIERSVVAEGPDGPIYAHGSFIYLIGRDGRVAALLPPILTPDRVAAVVARHL